MPRDRRSSTSTREYGSDAYWIERYARGTTADADETGGLDKKELERALAGVLNVFVVPAKDVEKAWRFMIGKRPMALEPMIAEVSIEVFFHWYVENVGSRLVSRSIP